nr:MAG TPA: hypothetical protein [Bacteriophage sp.]DAT04653.1 MAG TPA: hypothetical protein [Caudoviricetes sp.]DAV15584.1 MAG TPA: hypothetical protein [Caudoviricetes sp.]
MVKKWMLLQHKFKVKNNVFRMAVGDCSPLF